jgi:hypothetical protein
MIVDEVTIEPPSKKEKGHCWLCINRTHPIAQKLHTFMLYNVGNISVEDMASMMEHHLNTIRPDDEIWLGSTAADIQRHIEGGHILSPPLQVANILRSLIKLKDTLNSKLLVNDESGTELVVDTKNVNCYLKVISEIMQIYRTGEASKMLFYANEADQSAAVQQQNMMSIQP